MISVCTESSCTCECALCQTIVSLDSARNLLQNDHFTCPTRLKDIAALPCETETSQLLASFWSKDTVKTNVMLIDWLKVCKVWLTRESEQMFKLQCLHLVSNTGARRLCHWLMVS